MEEDAGSIPSALDGPFRDALHRPDLRKGKATEEFEIDDLRGSRIDGRQGVERLAEIDELANVDRGVGSVAGDCCELKLSTALGGQATARVVNDEASHDPGGITQEPGLVGEERTRPSRHLEVGLVQERGHAEAPATTLTRQLAPGNAMQLLVEERKLAPDGCVSIFRRRWPSARLIHGWVTGNPGQPRGCSAAKSRDPG